MSIKDKVILGILDREGGWVNDPSDSGGETNYGITIGTARRFGYLGPMIELTKSQAYHIYAEQYWNPLKLDDIATHSEKIAEELADTAVNMGVRRAGLFLQRSLNVLNNNQRYYNDIGVDGQVGPATIRAFNKYIVRRGEVVLFRMLNCLQGSFYIELAERRHKDQRFLFGWMLNRVN